jgi:Kelch motif protein/IPT/TIG domain-containing protein
MRTLLRGVVVSAVVAAVGCGDPTPPDGVIACAQSGSRVCPRGYQCIDGLCYHDGYMPSDMGVGGEGDDMAAPPDLFNDPCANGTQDPGEVDIDCGGTCAPCGPTKKCNGPSDCITASCTSGVCTLVSGPPNWLSVPAMMGLRAEHAMAADGSGRLYVYAGVKDYMNAAATTTERYTPGATAWEVLAGAPNNHGEYAGGATDGKGRPCAIAGHNPDAVNALDCYDPATSMWVGLANVPNYPSAFGAATAGGIIHIFGGSGTDSYAYSSASNAWVQTLAMPEPRSYVAAATGTDGLIYVVGGYDGTNPINTAQVYNPTTNAWATSKTSAMSSARFALVAAGGGDGRIYAIGGLTAFTGVTPLASVEAYTPATDKWATVAPLPTPLAYAGAAVGSDGRIYVAGGSNNMSFNPTSSVEAYGPVTALSAPSGAAGAQLTVSGSNFAVNAAVNVYFDSAASAPIATGTTDAVGGLASVNWTVPAVAAGAHRLIVVDVRSQFPSYAAFTVTP